MKSKQILVSGIVQGVGYRRYASLQAVEHKIVGWARNLKTSQVEVLAQYDDEALFDQFVAALKIGPPRSKVDEVLVIDVDSKVSSCDTFTIEPDGEKPSEFK